MPDTCDAALRQALAVVADADRGESPFGWSELPQPPCINRTANSGICTSPQCGTNVLIENPE
ncbi:hypothetical protein JHN59_37060 [Streptomyces sp. MBT49]|uniref:hypothetical protein n=1 Tax=unclassified Streptomyces TaxID=2593676 RepID=UPI00190DCC8B|nr:MULTISPECIES: hypothetical protein [unclassified Streptomyces]MBK3630311.1 hypothetical protein [Streptomyces sp. MBT49]MBK3634698.1 hypothetical protein [Streptomyces sp. MBT97]